MTRSRPFFSLLCALAVVGAPAAAHAAAIDAARKAYADLAYAACRDQAQGALEEPGSKDDRTDAYRLLGLCQAALGETDAARDAFVKMLAVDADADLPKGLSPRFTSSYLEAKGHWVGQKPLELVVEEDRVEGKRRVIRVFVRDAADLVDKVTWEDEDGERAAPLKAAERMELEVAAEGSVRLLGLDAHAGVVAEQTLASQDLAAADVVNTPATNDRGGGAEDPGAGAWLWVGVAAGAGVLLAGGAAAVAGVMLAPPSDVTLRSQVVFGNP